MTLADLAGKRVAFLGFDKTNRSLYHAIRRVHPDLHLEIRDMSLQARVPEDDVNVTSVLGETYKEGLDALDVIIRSPGVPYHPELDAVRGKVTTSLNLFVEHVRSTSSATIVGVTGTKGKSTTATLLAHTLQSAERDPLLIGNIDIQEWDHVDVVTDDTIVVYEMSSYMLEDFTGAPDIAILLPIYADHMDWHGGLDQYVEAKSHITTRQSSEDLLILPATSDHALDIAKTSDAQTIIVETPEGLHVDDAQFMNGDTPLFPTSALPLPGNHWQQNALGVIAALHALDVDNSSIEAAFQTFEGLPHRLQTVTEINGITYVDDAISTTPESTVAAINAFENLGSLVLGGLDRGYNYDELAQLIASRNVPLVVLLPGGREKITRALHRANYTGEVINADTMHAVVEALAQNTPKDHVALLSTAAPSYDLFTSFKDKGHQFQETVWNLQS